MQVACASSHSDWCANVRLLIAVRSRRRCATPSCPSYPAAVACACLPIDNSALSVKQDPRHRALVRQADRADRLCQRLCAAQHLHVVRLFRERYEHLAVAVSVLSAHLSHWASRDLS
jgi:hypothetical protein